MSQISIEIFRRIKKRDKEVVLVTSTAVHSTGKVSENRGVGRGRIFWLKRLRTWTSESTSKLFLDVLNRENTVRMICKQLERTGRDLKKKCSYKMNSENHHHMLFCQLAESVQHFCLQLLLFRACSLVLMYLVPFIVIRLHFLFCHQEQLLNMYVCYISFYNTSHLISLHLQDCSEMFSTFLYIG